VIRSDGLYLPEPGDLLVNNGERILIGHVNALGGTCDDCWGAPWGRKFTSTESLLGGAVRFWYALDPGWTLERNVLDAL
jgi:hypothetical protein